MELSRSLVKDFADIAHNRNVKEEPSIHVRGTIKIVGDKKFVQLDGSDALTPLTETVDVQDKDRVLVAIENHTATVLGNFTFPPSARKEQEAIDKAEDAQDSANDAIIESGNANNKADQAISQAGDASSKAEDAKQSAQEAVDAADAAKQDAANAKDSATQASQAAGLAKEEAEKAQNAVQNANEEIGKINKVVDSVKGDITSAITELEKQANDIQATKETLELEYSKKTEVSSVEANLKTEISKKVGELQTTVEENYAAKNDIVSMEGRLQTQITQNAQGLISQSKKVEKLESDTEEAQKQVDIALEKADNAQNAATIAQNAATASQEAADSAKENAELAQQKANDAKTAAEEANSIANAADKKVQAAQNELNEAKQNLTDVSNRVGVTEDEIADAQAKVDRAQEAVNGALADAAEATLAANKAQDAANQAQSDATQAQLDATLAQQKADNAQDTADAAQSAAEKAQQEVAELTKRVVTAETEIRQTAEAIELAAKKVEEIGNELKNNYYTKTETDAAIKLEADGIVSTVTKVESKIDNLKIGGKNLLYNSDDNYIGSNTPLANYKMTEKMEDSKSYVCKIWGKLGNGKTGFEIRLAENNSILGVTKPDSDGNHIVSFSGQSISTDSSGIIIYPIPPYPQSESTIDKIKLELGNKPTDFSLAPEEYLSNEDFDDALNGENGLTKQIETSKSEIKQLANSIANLVTDENGTSLMTQTSDGFHFNIGAIQNKLNNLSEDLSGVSGSLKDAETLINEAKGMADALEQKTAFIDMTSFNGQPAILLGQSNSKFKLRITNTSIDFLDGSESVAYISNKVLYITKAIIKDEIQFGESAGWSLKKRSIGNLGLRWVENDETLYA